MCSVSVSGVLPIQVETPVSFLCSLSHRETAVFILLNREHIILLAEQYVKFI